VSRKFFELVRQSRRYGSCFGQHDVVLLLDYWLRLQAAMQFLRRAQDRRRSVTTFPVRATSCAIRPVLWSGPLMLAAAAVQGTA
jgi:hypothetical protein